DPVLVLQAMGRKIGFIPAAARLADPNREMPLLIYLAESPGSLQDLADSVNDCLKQNGRCVVVVSEGFDIGEIGARQDSFGHTSFGSSELTVAQAVVNYLNQAGLATKGLARCNVPGTDQRHSIGYASTVDLDEAYRLGQKALELAATGQGGYMSTILRDEGPIYNVRYDKVPLMEVANSERTFPKEWITANGRDVSEEFVKYVKPLVGEEMVSLPMIDGRHRLTRFAPIFAEKKLAPYVPQADRK
ncbi:MAG: 6-phosphofructokinase, partial [Planctomycetaceae bacterium]|nr:6-phosphofructokinase [Planctomycetaceae bacterium]